MSEAHHHHHHKPDGASVFKHKSLKSIQRRKQFRKFGLIAMTILAVIMFCAVVFVYTVG